jgi:hypothetical protein
MGSVSSIESKETVPTYRGSLEHQDQPLEFRNHGARVREIPEHPNARRDPPPTNRQKVRRTRTHESRLKTERPGRHEPKETIGSLLSCSITERLLAGGDTPMPFIRLDKGSERLDFSGFRDRRKHWVRVDGPLRLLETVGRAILAVLRTKYKGRSIHGGPDPDPRRDNTLLFTTSDRIDWRGHFGPCVSCARHGLQALAACGVTEEQVKQLFERKGSGFEFKLLAKLFVESDERFAFTKRKNTGHAVVKLQPTWRKPRDATLVENLIELTFELRKIGAYDAIFAVLDALDEISKHMSIGQGQLIELYIGLTGASRIEVAKCKPHECGFLLEDLRVQLIVGLCDEGSGYCDPVMAAKVMLRQARLNAIVGELPASDMVIEALIATKIPLKRLEKALGRKRTGMPVSAAELRWWGKLERRFRPAPQLLVDRALGGRTARALGEPPLPIFPRFSEERTDQYEQVIRLRGVDRDSPMVNIILYGLRELADADEVSLMDADKDTIRIGISRADGGLGKAVPRATSGLAAMFRSFHDLVIAPERVERFFAVHQERQTPDLFSRGILKLLARPDASMFRIDTLPNHWEIVPKPIEEGRWLECAQHLVETLSDLVWFGAYGPAMELLPNLVHFLDYIEETPDLENRMRHLVQGLANQAGQPPSAWISVHHSLRSIKTSLHQLVRGGPRYDPLQAASWVVRDAGRPDDGQEAEIYAAGVIAELARFMAEDLVGDDLVQWVKQEVGAAAKPGPVEAAFWARLESRLERNSPRSMLLHDD